MNAYEYAELGRTVAAIAASVFGVSMLLLVIVACLKAYGARNRRYWGK